MAFLTGNLSCGWMWAYGHEMYRNTGRSHPKLAASPADAVHSGYTGKEDGPAYEN
jgi:hypothetical protein